MAKLVQISSGKGPVECELAVGKYLNVFLYETKDAEIVSVQRGSYEGCYKSVVLAVPETASIQTGTVKWITASPFRPKHKRKNWFIDIALFEKAEEHEITEALIKYETFHSGGKGGQNVNKVETGVRAIHIPSGTAATSTTARTQHMNKRLALNRLMDILMMQKGRNEARLAESMHLQHELIERGNPVCTFRGTDFVKVK